MPNPSQHLHPHPPRTAAAPEWNDWSKAWTRHIPTLTGRTDLTVLVAPGAGGGAPACFYPQHHRIEIDATHIGSPDIANPRRAAHKKTVPTAYGLLVHEAAHAAHSRWQAPDTTPPILGHVADLLEESRAEAQHRQRRRGDRRWLRHTVTQLISPADAPVDDPWHAAHVAALLLARADARILTYKDVRRVRATVTAILGRARLTQLREVWRAAHTVADTDHTTMIELARRWCAILGITPRADTQAPVADPGEFPGRLADAITDYLAAAHGLTPAEYTHRQITHRHAAPATWTRRDPTPAEQHAARQLTNQLRHARTRHPEPATRPATVPPGRLRTRHAITLDAQKAAGTLPTAAPWRRRASAPPPKPSLRLAVLVDVSGSMRAYAQPMSSAGWILAHAAHRADAVTTTIAFAGAVTLLTPPRHRPTHVLEMNTRGGTTTFTDAVKLADQLLDLRHRNTLRMLAVVSDGALPDTDPAQKLITTLHHAGCAVLWLHPADLPGHTYQHTATLTINDPVDAITHIAQAALHALATA